MNTRKFPPNTLEHLEARIAPAVAYHAAFSLHGVAGDVTLDADGTLTFTPSAPGKVKILDHAASAFNVDSLGNLWFLESDGDLFELPAGKTKAARRDTGAGSFSLSDSGIAEEVKANGDLWRYDIGARKPTLLTHNATAAEVDAAGNVYGLVDGNLLQWAPAKTAAVLLNDGGTGGGRGDVVSFQVGKNTVAWMLGYQDANPGRVVASYAGGASPALLTDNNTNGLMAVYDVAADGSVIVADPGAATNVGVTLLAAGKFNVDVSGADLKVNGVAKAGTSFQLSPDGHFIAVLDGAGGNLSAYTILSNSPGFEQKLVKDGTAQSFGFANDLKVYAFTKTAGLESFDPFVAVPVLTPAAVGTTVAQWQLSPSGQPAFLTTAHAFTVGTKTIPDVAQIGFAPNGQLDYLASSGSLFRGVGDNHGGFKFALIDKDSTAFSFNKDSTLIDIRSNGDVWELTGKSAKLPALNSTKTVVKGWTKVFAQADTGADVGGKQAGISTGTALFTLPDGDFFFLANQQIIQLSPDRALVVANAQTDLVWEANATTEAGVTVNVPAFNAVLGTGTFFSVLSGEGANPFPISLL